MTILSESLRAQLERVEEVHGSDNPLAQQLRIQIDALEGGGNAESVFQEKESLDNCTLS